MSGCGASKLLLTGEDLFKQDLWKDIFLVPGRWAQLVKTNWELPVVDQICLCVAGVRWKWASEGDTMKDTPARISRWLGTITGVTPDRARDWLEPYASWLDTGLIHSPTAREAQNRASAKWA